MNPIVGHRVPTQVGSRTPINDRIRREAAIQAIIEETERKHKCLFCGLLHPDKGVVWTSIPIFPPILS